MSATESLDWLSDIDEVRGPNALLHEYAEALSARTRGKVLGVVEVVPITSVDGPGEFASKVLYRISGEVPALRGCRTTLFETESVPDSEWTDDGLKSLQTDLDDAFRSDDVKETVRGLISAAS